MKRTFAIVLVFLAPLSWAGENTLKNKLNKRKAEILNPANTGSKPASNPAALPVPRGLADPWIGPPLFKGLAPTLGVEPGAPVRPRMTAEPAPLARDRSKPQRPEDIVFPTTELVALPTLIDVEQPMGVPILSQPIVDKASFADATLESSIVAALAAEVPSRSQPVAFMPMNLPDPFEFRQGAKLASILPESDTPMVSPPRILLPPAPAKK